MAQEDLSLDSPCSSKEQMFIIPDLRGGALEITGRSAKSIASRFSPEEPGKWLTR